MKRTVLILFAAFAINSWAADTAVKGHLIDVACSAAKARRGPASAASHGRNCLRMSTCAGSGYGVLTEDRQFIKFDKDGNEKAVKFLTEITKENDIKVTVHGSVNGSSMTVSSIELQ
jgi:hypothetical protein